MVGCSINGSLWSKLRSSAVSDVWRDREFDRWFCASLPPLGQSSVFPWPMVMRSVGTDRKNKIVDRSDRGFCLQSAWQGEGFTDPKGPWYHCCTFTKAETAEVVQTTSKDAAKSCRKWGRKSFLFVQTNSKYSCFDKQLTSSAESFI